MELKRPEINSRPGSLYKAMQHASWDVLSSLARLLKLEGGFLILSDLFLRRGEHEAWLDHLLNSPLRPHRHREPHLVRALHPHLRGPLVTTAGDETP